MTPDSGLSIRAVLPSLIVDGLFPYLTYKLVRAYTPGVSDATALGLSAVLPAGHGLLSVVRRRQVDVIGIVVLVGIAVSMAAVFVSGDPKLLLIRESFVTGGLGLVCLASLLWPRPLMFYVGRQLSAGQDPGRVEEFDALWQIPGARRTFRLLTIVWAAGWIGEFALRIAMVLTLSTAQVLAISPFVLNGITLGLMAWTFGYVKRRRRRAP